MSTVTETSDKQILDLLRRTDGMSVTELMEKTGVTATAVRQRLSRLRAQGLVEREVERAGRGRPSHRYLVTEQARQQAGSNFGDLSLVLWEELRAVQDPEIRRGLFQRIAARLAETYKQRVEGTELADRMQALQGLFAERDVQMQVDTSDGTPQLEVLDCPYPGLAEQDRGICAVEKMLFQELLGDDVRLSQCRLDGHSSCQFQSG